MAAVGMAQPVWGDGRIDARLDGRPLDHPVHSALCETGAALAAGEYGIIGACIASERHEGLGDDLRQEHLANYAALAEYGELHLIATRQHVRPCERHGL